MTYDPNQLEPPDNPNARWCDYCGDQLDAEEGFADLIFRQGVHTYCLESFCNGLLLRIKSLDDTIEKMVERGMS